MALSETLGRKDGFWFAFLCQSCWNIWPPCSRNKMTVEVFCSGVDIMLAPGHFICSGSG